MSFSKISPLSDFEDELAYADDFDLALTLALVTAAQAEVANLEKYHEDLLIVLRREEQNRRYHSNKRARREASNNNGNDESSQCPPRFPTWSKISGSISNNLFRRKYRMSKNQFALLCDRIKSKVGDSTFHAEGDTSYGLCGELRVAIGLRMLCGGSYLDLVGCAYGVQSPQSIYNHFHTFIDWIDDAFDFPLVGLLNGLNNGDADAIAKLKELSAEFAADSDMCFIGCIGAIDGLAIRIRCPSNVSDPGNYYCRKNFYALNVQAICDRSKRILWMSPGHLGSTHDSTAWDETKLKMLLEKIKDKMDDMGFFIVGDSAYPLSVYMQVPYPDAEPATSKDAFNFWLSNSRIRIECTFGELIMRFGLFWRKLRFGLNDCTKIIKAAAKLHNFLIDCREGTEDDDNYFRNLSYANIHSCSLFQTNAVSGEDDVDVNFPLVTDNNEPKPKGRKSNKRKREEDAGSQLRDSLCTSLHENGMVRPKRSNMRYNSLGHVYFEE